MQRQIGAWRWVAWGVCVWLGGAAMVSASPPAATATPPVAPPVSAASGKKPITHDVYDSWRSIQGTRLSRDGVWLVYALVPQDGDGELVARNLVDGTERHHPRGIRPQISPDGRFVAFAIAPARAEVERSKKAKKKPDEMPKNDLGVMNLATGVVTVVARVKSFDVAEKGGRFVVYLREAAPSAPSAPAAPSRPNNAKPAEGSPETPLASPPPAAAPAPPRIEPATGAPPSATTPPPVTTLPAPTIPPKPTPAEPATKPAEATESAKKKEPGTDLVVRDLATGAETTIPEVVRYAWNKTGTWLAYAVSSKMPEKDGAFARRVDDGVTRTLLSGRGNYKNLTFDEKGEQLAFVSDRDDYKAETPVFALYRWQVGDDKATQIAAAKTPGMPEGMVVSDSAGLDFPRDGARLFFGFAPAPKPKPKDAPEPIKVDIWSWKDADLQTQQKVRAEAERRRSFRAVWRVRDKTLVPLGGADLPTVVTGENERVALGTSDLPYRALASWDTGYDDVFLIGLQDGKRTRVLEKSRLGASLSPGGRYLLYWDDAARAWFTYRVRDGRRTDLTGGLPVRFENEAWDTPDLPRPYGVAGWTDEDAHVLLYDRYDIWQIRPDDPASARRVTGGRGRREQIVFRYQRLDPDARTIPTDAPLLLDAVHDRTKASGFYRTPAGIGTARVGEPVKLVMRDEAFGSPLKAENADRVVVTLSRFDEFPNLWTTDTSFADLRRVTDANPQQAQYRWGRSELIEYVNADGKTLRAILTKPENFDPTRKYPLMVYIYEELTNGLHRYTAPAPGTSINATRYVSNGYLLLEPDIVYTTGYPGESALKCVVPAVQTVLRLGYVDPDRIGIQGHSWGGYEIAYLITRTNLFRAVEAGAAVSDMVSAYGGIRYGTGISRAFQYERTQSRIGGTPWERPLQFVENSPIFWADKVQTPYLTLHNDGDGAVPWTQGIEFFTALRRLGREAYLFNYNGEDHGLRQRENQKHWTVHMAEFFDHYLLGTPRPAWMEQGVPYLERGTRDLTVFYGPAETQPASAPLATGATAPARSPAATPPR